MTIGIPAAANATADFHVTVTSLNPDVAVPLGAAGDSLVITFPTGGPPTQAFNIDALHAGTAAFSLSTAGAVCTETNLLIVTVPSPTITMTKSETFDTPESAAADGWGELLTRTNGQDFGFSSSTNAGGPAGEAGGFVKRDPTRTGYADIFSGQLSLNDVLHASGTVVVVTNDTGVNAGPIIGHVNSSDIGQNTEANQIGLECVYASGAPWYYARLTLANGSGYEVSVLKPAVAGQVYYWDYTYDPTAGPQGNGALIVNVTDGISGLTNSTEIDLTAADRQVGATFDSFGMYSRSLSSNALGTSAFMDNVSYTIPATLSIAGINLMNGNVRLSVLTTGPGASLSIEATSTINPPAWTTVDNVVYGTTNGMVTAEFPMPAGKTMFFRVALP